MPKINIICDERYNGFMELELELPDGRFIGGSIVATVASMDTVDWKGNRQMVICIGLSEAGHYISLEEYEDVEDKDLGYETSMLFNVTHGMREWEYKLTDGFRDLIFPGRRA